MTSPHAPPRGFTLIELLVVVAVIALLIAILLPSLAKARSLARRAACLATMRQWGIGFNMYADMNNDFLPYTGASDGNSSSNPLGYWSDSAYWANAVPPLLNSLNQGYNDLQLAALTPGGKALPASKTNSIFVCPEVNGISAGTGDVLSPDGRFFMMWGNDDSGAKTTRPVFWSYVTNSKIDNSIQHTDNTGHPFVKRSNIRVSPSTVPYLVEKMMSPYELNPPYGSSIARGKTTWTRMAARHSGGGNMAFIDGHCEWFSYKVLANAPAGLDGTGSIPGQVIWDPFSGVGQ